MRHKIKQHKFFWCKYPIVFLYAQGSHKDDDLTMDALSHTCSYLVSRNHDSWGFVRTQQLDTRKRVGIYPRILAKLPTCHLSG